MSPENTIHEYPGKPFRPEARILSVDEGSPADDAGFVPGCVITAVDGSPLRDIIDWQWLSDGLEIELSYTDTDGDSGTVVLERYPDEPWGFTFDGAVFDKVKTCRNACLFCFMRQLPADVRSSLVLRDDDFRLSFLQGNFVTLSNLTDDDVDRIIEQHISPLRVSLHAVSESVRMKMIGRHAGHGFVVLERLLEAGIQFDAQIVLMPGVNDGAELKKTLAWAYLHEGITNVGIVPVGFTRYQDAITRSFNDPDSAREVLEIVDAVSAHAEAERGVPWVYAADEFYINAFPEDTISHVPPREHYGSFDMFEDGIGLVRSFIDEWNASQVEISSLASCLEEEDVHVYYLVGCAQERIFGPLVEQSPLNGRLIPLFVRNEYFGGNVNVTGLLCGVDVARAARGVSAHDFVFLPRIMFNSDDVTLDDMTVDDIRDTAGMPISVVSCSPKEFLPEIEEIVRG